MQWCLLIALGPVPPEEVSWLVIKGETKGELQMNVSASVLKDNRCWVLPSLKRQNISNKGIKVFKGIYLPNSFGDQ